jgi:hypothetical protein
VLGFRTRRRSAQVDAGVMRGLVTHYEQPFVAFGQTIGTVGAAAVPLGFAEVDGDQAAPCHGFDAGDSCFRFHSMQNNGRQQTPEYLLRSTLLELVRAATQNQYDGREQTPWRCCDVSAGLHRVINGVCTHMQRPSVPRRYAVIDSQRA